MEQLIIFLLFVVGSIISSILQHKKKKAEEQQQRELEELTRRGRGEPVPPAEPQSPFPKTAADWQEQLRRMLEGETTPPVPKPPVIKPVLLPPVQKQQPPRTSQPKPPPPQKQKTATRERSEGDLEYSTPLKTSAAHYERAAKLHATITERMRGVSAKTSAHKASPIKHKQPRRESEFVSRLRRNRGAIREAFIASIIFGPPKCVEQSAENTNRG